MLVAASMAGQLQTEALTASAGGGIMLSMDLLAGADHFIKVRGGHE
jgi:hypothetical protein